jgi:hypothetical protein
VIEVGHRVELYGLIAPLALDTRPQLRRHSRRLADVSFDDFVILIHCRDPWRRLGKQNGLSGL